MSRFFPVALLFVFPPAKCCILCTIVLFCWPGPLVHGEEKLAVSFLKFHMVAYVWCSGLLKHPRRVLLTGVPRMHGEEELTFGSRRLFSVDVAAAMRKLFRSTSTKKNVA